MPSANIPVGCVTPFAGDLSNAAVLAAVIAAGWLPCDGSSYDNSTYPALRSVIGTAHGGGDKHFNVPSLSGRYNRGTSGGSGNDPDASLRVEAATGGNTGNMVGSLQSPATALPNNLPAMAPNIGHAHSYAHLSNEQHEAWNGNTDEMASGPYLQASTSGAGVHSHALAGGDQQTQPVSLALSWIIRATIPATTSGATPVGAICAFGASADSPPTGWLKCNGSAQSCANVPALTTAIGSNYGGDGVTALNLPDIRGRFVRGTNHGATHDPDAATRTAQATGGNTGDHVGSVQGYATAQPQAGNFVIQPAGDHVHTLVGVPVADHHAAAGASGPAAGEAMHWTSNSTQTSVDGVHVHQLIGGDHETRPWNIYRDWMIAPAPIASDAPPIGSIMAYGGDVTSITTVLALVSDGWLPCIGGSIAAGSYEALYDVIGTIFGTGSEGAYYLPDLRGYFVLGTGGSSVGTVTQGYTGAPFSAFSTTSAGEHTHTVVNVPTSTQEIDVVMGWDLAEANSAAIASSKAGLHTHDFSAALDNESRPINIYVDYI